MIDMIILYTYFLLLSLSQVSFQMLNKICFTHFHLLLFTNSNGSHYPLLLASLVVIFVYYSYLMMNQRWLPAVIQVTCSQKC